MLVGFLMQSLINFRRSRRLLREIKKKHNTSLNTFHLTCLNQPTAGTWYTSRGDLGCSWAAVFSCSAVQLCSLHPTLTVRFWEPNLCVLTLELALVRAGASTPTNLSSQVCKIPGGSNGSFQGWM